MYVYQSVIYFLCSSASHTTPTRPHDPRAILDTVTCEAACALKRKTDFFVSIDFIMYDHKKVKSFNRYSCVKQYTTFELFLSCSKMKYLFSFEFECTSARLFQFLRNAMSDKISFQAIQLMCSGSFITASRL